MIQRMISYASSRLGRFAAPTAALLIASLVHPAAAAISDWQGEGKAKVRLVAAGIDADGRLAAGIEIAIEPGWKTYWRTPGDAGIAPVIDFSASTNVAGRVLVEFPVPHRVDDGYAAINVYQDRVVLPVTAALLDPNAATRLVLSLDIGVCAEICVPEHYDLTLELLTEGDDAEAAAILAEARAALPREPEPGIFDVAGVAHAGGTDKRPVFEIAIVAPEAATAEVFVEGPVDWYPAPPKLVTGDGARATFSVEFSRLGAKTPIGGNAFTVTVVSGGEAIEDVVTLD
jgi:DsbC/DsbD-like thiol-disulfide interchange protein